MKAFVEHSHLLAALGRISGVADGGLKAVPIVGNVALRFTDGALELRGTDLDMEATETIPANVQEPGETTISADKLHDIVRSADAGAQIAISSDEKDPRIVVKAGRSVFRMAALPYGDFPSFRSDGLGAPWSMPAKTLADMLGRVGWCTEPSHANDHFRGIYLGSHEAELHVVGCHHAGMALRREKLPEGAQISEVLLPKFTAQAIRWLSEFSGDVEVSAAPNSLIRIKVGAATLTAKVFGGQFFNYMNALMEAQAASAQTDQDAMKSAVRRVMITGEAKSGSVRIKIADGAIVFGARNDLVGEGSDEIACDYEGEDASIMLPATRLQAALASLRGDAVELGFVPQMDPAKNRTGQVIIRAPSDPGLVVNIMQPRA